MCFNFCLVYSTWAKLAITPRLEPDKNNCNQPWYFQFCLNIFADIHYTCAFLLVSVHCIMHLCFKCLQFYTFEEGFYFPRFLWLYCSVYDTRLYLWFWFRMGTRKKTQSSAINGSTTSAPNTASNSLFARNLTKNQLGGVIFGCKKSTIKECLSKQLFG